jgi:hypothetical protein
MLVLAMTVLFAATSAQAGGGKRCRDFSRLASFSMYGVSEWIANRFTDAELKTYGLGDFSIEQCLCNCADQPAPHYPYVLMLFRTPKGDLVGRPGPRGVETVITPLAVRHGERYCEVGDEEQCFGSFADPCEFTDFRYGDELAKYFPYCKPEDAHLR